MLQWIIQSAILTFAALSRCPCPEQRKRYFVFSEHTVWLSSLGQGQRIPSQ